MNPTTNNPTPRSQKKNGPGLALPDQRQQIAERILQTFQAPNPEYNINAAQALAAVAALKAFNFQIDALVVSQTLSATGFGAQEITLQELTQHLKKSTQMELPQDVPLYFLIHSNGQPHALAPIYADLETRPFTATMFRQMWTSLAPQFNTAADDLQNVPGVAQATESALAAVIDKAFNRA